MPGVLIHEWVSRSGGSEKVLDAMADAFPDADMHVLWSDATDRYPRRDVVETWLARSPLRRSKALALPLMPATWRGLSSSTEYDWMLVSSHLFAHHARFRNQDIPKLVYAHTPARYIWTPELDHRGSSLAARAASAVLKPLDRRRAQEPVSIAANSMYVRDRIAATWEREAEVIYPPVDTERILAGGTWVEHLAEDEVDIVDRLPETYLLGASRFIPYKNLDRVIDAGRVMGLPVVLAGSGVEEARLRAHAAESGVNVTFVLRPSDAMLFTLYQRAFVYVFPPIEDFGIMPVEAMACGTPVIANAAGGASESVLACEGGVVMSSFGDADWVEAFRNLERIDRTGLATRAQRFSRSTFDREIKQWVASEFVTA